MGCVAFAVCSVHSRPLPCSAFPLQDSCSPGAGSPAGDPSSVRRPCHSPKTPARGMQQHVPTARAIWKGEAVQNGAVRAPPGIKRVCLAGNPALKTGAGGRAIRQPEMFPAPPGNLLALLLNEINMEMLLANLSGPPPPNSR